MQKPLPLVRHIDSMDYARCATAMRQFTAGRNEHTADEFWVLEHPPVFTLGQAGKPEHVLNAGDIPVIQTDRGGQVTWHGPGQTVIYLLLDLHRLGLGIRELVHHIEQAIINFLGSLDIQAERQQGAPGVYVGGRKIAALGLRIRRGATYHGLSLNRNPDPDVWQRINPCGYPGQTVTSLAELDRPSERVSTEAGLLDYLLQEFGYAQAQHTGEEP